MKIKFIKEYRAFGNLGLSGECVKVVSMIGDVVDVDEESARWLIDNGFAEEVKESGGWKPMTGDRYYFIDDSGCIKEAIWGNNFWDVDRYKLGNVFKTEEAAIRCRDYMEAIATVRQDEGVLTPEQVNELGRNSGVAYYVGCVGKHNGGKMLCECKMSLLPWTPVGMILFDTKEHAQASQDKHSDEWKIIANYDWSRE